MSSQNHEIPVRESIRQLSHDSWVIGGRILLSRTKSSSGFPSTSCTWSDGDGAYFSVSEYDNSNNEDLPGEPLPKGGPIEKVHDAGDASAVWSIGDAFLKVRALQTTTNHNTTREHITLDYLHNPTKFELNFPAPRALYHAEFGSRYYLITSRIPGQTLETTWPQMTELEKQFCVDRVVNICKDLVRYGGESSAICGVDGKHLNENWMSPPGKDDRSPEAQLAYCSEIGMVCSDLVLAHNDMGPYNVIVNLARMDNDSVGIIDWEMAGYVPRHWVRTKFRVCFAMDFDFPGDADERRSERVGWRRRVQQKLEQEDFPDVAEAYITRYNKSK
ncbi:hypothetical protein CTA2_8968 [Colletotrichum tanaceti]|uniref:Aminoglycoside phosphotransferase domain-containing protein n=1 Tax=Colletotrichum tanaceti TaxID=1306861 RepID=A0A4U6XKC7_9PEZI|nr:hypothetical protein CTA2_8968 [Colletotrichum tanaceti]TKW56199.1 hypothetical protein CTA1_6196 [Colletotrichum tanaceti]